MERPSDETLMSFADGVATPDERARVERAMAEDPAVRDRVDAMRRSAVLLAEAFDRPMRETPPQHLVDMILSAPAGAANEDGTQRRSRVAGVRWGINPALALAASIAVLVAVGAGFLAGNWTRPATPSSAVALGAVPPGNSLASLLENQPSGSTAPVVAGNDDRRFTVLASFRDRQKRACREFELLAAPSAGAHPLVAAVACRGAEGGWSVEGAVRLAETAQSGQPGYEPSGAGEQDALEGLLNALGASPVLSAREEIDLIAKGWRQ